MANSNPMAAADITTTARALTAAAAWNFSAAEVAACTGIRVTTSGADIRFTTNGDTPTTSLGHIIKDGYGCSIFKHSRDAPADFQCIEASGSGTASVTIELIGG